MPPIHSPAIRSCAGFTYIGLLILVAIMGVTLAMIGTFWHAAQQRVREQQLLFIGNQFSHAIGAYYQTSPQEGKDAGIKHFPKRLEDLLQDNRHQTTVRHLRKIFVDPVTGTRQWGLIKGADGGIVGVYSLSEAAPLKTANFSKGNEKFANKKHYSEWQFTYSAGSMMFDANGTPVNQTPVDTTPPEYQVPPVPPLPPEPTADQRKKHLCDVMRVNDARMCALQATKFGSAAGTACMASANERYAICTSAQIVTLPILAIRNK